MDDISESRLMLVVIFPPIDLNVVLFSEHYNISPKMTVIIVNIVMPFAVEVNAITNA